MESPRASSTKTRIETGESITAPAIQAPSEGEFHENKD